MEDKLNQVLQEIRSLRTEEGNNFRTLRNTMILICAMLGSLISFIVSIWLRTL